MSQGEADLLLKVSQLLRSISTQQDRLPKLLQLRDIFENEDEEVLDVLFKHLAQQHIKSQNHILRVVYNVLKNEMENEECLSATLTTLVRNFL
jgi:hypothetical protein